MLSTFAGGALPEGQTHTREPPNVRLDGRCPALVALAGPDEGKVFKLRGGVAHVIGRAPEAQVRLVDDGVSRQHARISVDGDDVVLEDLGSHNGTFVGLERVTRRRLEPDDLVRVGAATVLKFCCIDPVEEQFRLRLLAATLRDLLTGVYNRRHFDDRIAAECAAARRHGRPLALLVVDIDDFRAVNDAAGHPVGDGVLRAVASTLVDSVRREDMVFRYGGEEFAVVAREADATGARELGERIRRRVARRHFGGVAGAGLMGLTVSVGVVVLMRTESDEAFLARAEAALARAKGGGKDQVVVG